MLERRREAVVPLWLVLALACGDRSEDEAETTNADESTSEGDGDTGETGDGDGDEQSACACFTDESPECSDPESLMSAVPGCASGPICMITGACAGTCDLGICRGSLEYSGDFDCAIAALRDGVAATVVVVEEHYVSRGDIHPIAEPSHFEGCAQLGDGNEKFACLRDGLLAGSPLAEC